ncbi:MAG: saccharopine dehydrogenase NADP-binding domain-containing protein [Bacteroidetes bacterium]|nr:saccharopine dehydrogenase NADP-binding domain-containing protein [Bacteroidota bacterium]
MQKNVLILGAGLVAQPIVRYLLSQNMMVTVASNTPDRAKVMVDGHKNGIVIDWSIDNELKLEEMISNNDIVVSLLPYVFHLTVAKYAIKYKKNMVTTSYVKPEMYALDAEAKAANIVIINECGLDPGIDHMSAMRIIDHVHDKGGKVDEFYSICGALPAPEAANNPFGYKFSWSPKGVVLAGNNDAKYLKHGKITDVPTKNLFKDIFTLNINGVGDLNVYPNRDSLPYIEIYGIPEAKTMFRGTFRFIGWCGALDAIKQLSLISNDKIDFTGKTYADMMCMLIGASDKSNIRKKTAEFLNLDETAAPLNNIEWLGLFEDKPMNRGIDTTFEITSDLMIAKMELGQTERDMVVLQHVFMASYPDGTKEVIKSSMLDYGTLATDTSIARTVALPAAIAVKMILENKIEVKGVHIPVIPGIYNPILNELETLNIKMVEEYGLPMSAGIE